MHSRKIVVVTSVLLGLTGLRIWATAAPTSWLWGLDGLADLPAGLRWGGLSAFLICILPPVGRRVMTGVGAASRHRRFALSLSLIGFALLIMLVPTRHALHGDAQVLLSTLEKGLHAAGAAHREPLAQWIVTSVHRFVIAPLGGEPSHTFRVVGMLCGVACLALAIALAARLADTVRGRTLVATAVAATGAWPLFAGHAELYGIALVPLLAFVLVGLRWIDGRGGLIGVGILFALAGLCHAQLAFTLPGLLLLAHAQWRAGGRLRALFALGVVPILVLGVLLAVDYPFGDLGREMGRRGVFLPPLSRADGRTAYTIYSWAHAVDFVNVSWLLAPLFWILLPASMPQPRGGGGSALKLRFLASIAVGPLLFAFAAGPALGMVRDWDLYSIAFVLASLWVAARAVRVFELPGGHARISDTRSDASAGFESRGDPDASGGLGSRGDLDASRVVKSPISRVPRGHAFTARENVRADALAGTLFVFAILHAAAWLIANHDETAARARLERVVKNERFFGPTSRGEIWRYLASTDVRAGRGSEAARAYLESIRADPKETIPYRQFASLVIQGALARGRPAKEGMAAYHEAVQQGVHGEAEAHLGGLFAAIQAGDETLAVEEAKALLEAEPMAAEYQAIWADLARRAGETGEAEAWYRRALTTDPSNVRAILGLACLAGMRGDRAEMQAQLDRARSLSPWSMFVQQFDGMIEDPAGISPARYRALLFYR